MSARTDKRPKRWWVLTPTLGICLFIFLYGLAACQYPGGSNIDRTAIGFSWQHNYWCDLLGNVGKNGINNPARPIALAAMLVLCGSLAFFWWQLPDLYQQSNRFIRLSRWAGPLSMLIILFIGTPYHDSVTNTAGTFGVVALTATFTGLYYNRQFGLIVLGMFCMLLVGLNNYVYYTHHYLFYLPVLQKATFLFFLTWVVLTNWVAYRATIRR